MLRRLRAAKRMKTGGVVAHEGLLSDKRVLMLAGGMGGAASIRARAVLSNHPAFSQLWVAGYGGGLDPALEIGDVVVSPGFPDGFVVPSLVNGRRAVAGKILHVDEVVGEASEKARLFRRSGALCCEMESGIVGGLAEEREIPWGTVRAISDTADQDIPSGVLQAAWDNDAHRPTPGRLLLRMAMRPHEGIEFFRFVHGLRTPRENLARVLEGLIAAS